MFLRTASARCSSEQRRSEGSEGSEGSERWERWERWEEADGSAGDWLSPSLPRNRLPIGLTEANDRLFARDEGDDADADADGLGAVKQLFFRSVMLSSFVACAQPARDKCGRTDEFRWVRSRSLAEIALHVAGPPGHPAEQRTLLWILLWISRVRNEKICCPTPGRWAEDGLSSRPTYTPTNNWQVITPSTTEDVPGTRIGYWVLGIGYSVFGDATTGWTDAARGARAAWVPSSCGRGQKR